LPVWRKVFGRAVAIRQNYIQRLTSDDKLTAETGACSGSDRAGIACTVPLADHDRLDLSGFVRHLGKSTLGIGSILGSKQGN
jgi:hypothetical protein